MYTDLQRLMAAMSFNSYRPSEGNEIDLTASGWLVVDQLPRPNHRSDGFDATVYRSNGGSTTFSGRLRSRKSENLSMNWIQMEWEMNESQRTHARIGLIFALLVSLLPLSGCTGEVERRWSEEVELDDGHVVVIDRYAKFREANSLAGDAYSSTELKSKLSFRGELESLPSWEVPLVPLVLYLDDAAKEWVVVASTYSCEVWSDRGRPTSPYWEFRLRQGRWVQTELAESSKGRKTNLFFDYESDLPSRNLSRAQKAKIIKSNNFYESYLTIDANKKSNCG